MDIVANGHQGKEAVIFVAYFKIIGAMGVEHRDKGSALFHIIFSRENVTYSKII